MTECTTVPDRVAPAQEARTAQLAADAVEYARLVGTMADVEAAALRGFPPLSA